MANIVKPTVEKSFFLTPQSQGRKPLVSKMDIASATAPEYIGQYVLSEVAPDSIIAFLHATKSELVFSKEQLMWNETDEGYFRFDITGKGVLSRTGDVFTINQTALPVDQYDFDSSRPDKAQFLVAVGQRFVVIDGLNKINNGEVISLGADGTTITAKRTDSDDDFDVATSDLEIIWTGYNLDYCECPPCIGYKGYSPTRENSMIKDGVCLEYCDEAVIAEGGNVYEPWKTQDGEYWLNFNLNRKSQELFRRTDNIYAFERRNAPSKAGGKPMGTKGLIQTLEERAVKVEGGIKNLDDLEMLSKICKQNGVTEANIFCTVDQYADLQKIVNLNPGLKWDPFENHQSDLLYLGYGGISMFNGVKFFFKDWAAMNGKYSSVNLAKKYPFIVVPMNRIQRVIDGKTYETGHLAIAYFGNDRKVYKHLRIDEVPHCDKFKIQYVNKFMPLVFFPERFILGING